MFDHVRAVYLEHGVNLNRNGCRWYADVPRTVYGTRRAEIFRCSEADYSTRIWTKNENDKESFHMYLNISDLYAYAQKRYVLLADFNQRLTDIANIDIGQIE